MKINLLSKNEITLIHEKSLEILEKVGTIIPHPKLLQLFKDHGANVDHKKQLVRIPSELIMELLSYTGKEFTLYGRDFSKTAVFGKGKRNYNTSGGQALWIENEGKARRYATLEDVITATRFADNLDQITIPGAMADPHEIPVEVRCINIAYEMIKNTLKPITFWFYDRASTKYLMDLIITLRGDEKSAIKYPICYPLFEPVSPLTFPFNGIDLLFETSKLNTPVQIGPMAQMGITAPATIAGTLAQENAEILAGICIVQLIKKGTPVCYGGICHAFEMRSMQIIFGGPEQIIFSLAMSEVGKHYGLPVYINAGLTDSKIPDAQAGLECGATLAFGIASGADIFGHMGISGADQAASLDMLILQSEIISYLERLQDPIKFENSDFAVDIIEKVGPKGSFISNRHTLQHFKRDLWFPTLLDRNNFENWKNKGGYSIRKYIKKRKEQLLSKIVPPPITPDLTQDLETVLNTAKKQLLP
jgi:trimethylamine--corrinoid protein Co-methyltransferase